MMSPSSLGIPPGILAERVCALEVVAESQDGRMERNR
jgi:hypothetical protein